MASVKRAADQPDFQARAVKHEKKQRGRKQLQESQDFSDTIFDDLTKPQKDELLKRLLIRFDLISPD